MTNKISTKIYARIKNDTDITVISFENGQRLLTYGGLNYVSALHEVIRQTTIGRDVIVFRPSLNPGLDTTNRDIAYFRANVKPIRRYELDEMLEAVI